MDPELEDALIKQIIRQIEPVIIPFTGNDFDGSTTVYGDLYGAIQTAIIEEKVTLEASAPLRLDIHDVD